MYLLLEDGCSRRQIAKALGRSVSTISDEISRNSVNGVYTPKKAQHKAYVRRRESKFQGKKIVAYPELRASVDIKLREGRSPASIAGRIRTHETHLPSISADSIERYLKSPHGRIIEYERRQLKLAQRRKRRTKRKAVASLCERTFIDDRPEVINTRSRVGDAEADFIVSGKDGTGILLTLADRKLRIGFIEKVLPVTIPNVPIAFLRIRRRFPELCSVTTDNDILLQHHKELEAILGIPIYFCHPYHSWEKGTIENVNGAIRVDIPKGSDISQYDEAYLAAVEQKINNRYLELLDFATPQEALDRHRSGSREETSIDPNDRSRRRKRA